MKKGVLSLHPPKSKPFVAGRSTNLRKSKNTVTIDKDVDKRIDKDKGDER